MKEITPQQRNAITIVRVLSMLLIITCHILQGYNQPTAYLFNVGVQIFFLLSGFLYGNIEITSIASFVKKRLVKVYIPFILVVLCCAAIYSIFNIADVSVRKLQPYLFAVQGFVGDSIEGLNHLWFLSVLMICYIITPISQKILKYNKLWFVVLWVIVCIAEFGFIQKMQSVVAWVMLYLLGMLWGKNENKWINTTLLIIGTILSLAMISCFKIEYLFDPHMVRYSIGLHCILALWIMTVLYCMFSKIEIRIPKWLQCCNDISYEVYLVHHILILGPLSLLFLTPSKTINILLILIITFVLSYALNQLMNLIKRIL
jgi:peptidoglycan/LPS O-acetylase OafA/YrhL